eukprot:scaffold544227_cov18-Prasinocladus_malaysianus.AAC.1
MAGHITTAMFRDGGLPPALAAYRRYGKAYYYYDHVIEKKASTSANFVTAKPNGHLLHPVLE